MADRRVLLIVSPEGVLHSLADDKKARIAFCRAHRDVRNEYLQDHIDGRRDQTNGWQLLAKVKWLRNSSLGVVVPIVGSERSFFSRRAAVCELAGLPASAMPWHDKQLRRGDRQGHDEQEAAARAAANSLAGRR